MKMTDIESNGGFTNICHDFPREKSMETERENYKMHADVEEPNQKTYGMFSGSLGS
jgi:hypothetical protein